MPLIINQGKQDVSKDVGKFPPIVGKNILVTITQIKLADNIPNTLYIKMQVLEGEFKNRYVDDKVTFDPQSPLSWKYRNVRRAVGVPYSEGEPTNIDIEAILLNKALRVDLGIKEGVDKKTNEARQYQTINYKPLQDTSVKAPIPNQNNPYNKPKVTPANPLLDPKPVVESNDSDDLPW